MTKARGDSRDDVAVICEMHEASRQEFVDAVGQRRAGHHRLPEGHEAGHLNVTISREFVGAENSQRPAQAVPRNPDAFRSAFAD